MPSNDSAMGDGEAPDLVSSILNSSAFKLRPDEEKLTILRRGRPLPKLNIIKRDNNRNCNRTFQSSWYDIHKWLCGSQTYNKLFCWPCLLMRPETSSWCSTGNDDMKRFTSLATKHGMCKSHLKAIAEYDEALTQFNLPPEFIHDLNIKCKEEEIASEESDAGVDLFSLCFKDKEKPTAITDTSISTKAISCLESNKNNEAPKPTTKITFRAWKEINKDRFPISSSQYLDDYKLFKWKKKIAKQELKNARLTGEKLKFEIEVLKAKAEYYRLIKEEISPVVNTEITGILQ